MHYTFKDGIKDGMPICFGYLCVSIGFGVAAVSKGISTIATLLISMTNLTSAGQLAGVEIIATAGLIVEMILVQLTINARYSLMAISLTQKLDSSFTTLHRMLTGFFITDEIFAVAAIKPGKINNKYMYGLGTMPYIGWALGTLLGALAGTLLPTQISAALGIAIYGMFIAIVVPEAKKDWGVLLAVVFSGALSTVFYFVPLFKSISTGFALIICAIFGAVLAAIIKPVEVSNE